MWTRSSRSMVREWLRRRIFTKPRARRLRQTREGNSHKKAQKSQKGISFCDFCAFLWLFPPSAGRPAVVGSIGQRDEWKHFDFVDLSPAHTEGFHRRHIQHGGESGLLHFRKSDVGIHAP